MPPTTMPDGDTPVGVSTTFLAEGDGEEADGTPFVEMRVERTAEVADAGCVGFVGFEDVLCAGEGCGEFCVDFLVLPDFGRVAAGV